MVATVEVFADDPTVAGGAWSTLASGYTSGATSLTITSNASYGAADPTASPPTKFRFRIDNELFVCTDNRTTTWTVAGAQEGSSAANHSSGATVTELVTKGSLQELQTGVGVPGIFGDGSDGAVTISSNTTLSRDMYYDTLVVNSSVILTTGGWRVFVRNLLTNNGTISNKGNDGQIGGGSAGTGAGSGAYYAATVSGGSSGTTTGTAGSSMNPGVGGAGGAGGTGSSGAGGAGGTVTNPPTQSGGAQMFANLINAIYSRPMAQNAPYFVGGGAAGGSGGGDTANWGGGGGAGGGIVGLFARLLAGTGTVRADGGAGGSPVAGNGGGGGGGGGGVVLLASEAISNPYTVNVAGGASGAKQGTGTNGTAGSTGRSHIFLGV